MLVERKTRAEYEQETKKEPEPTITSENPCWVLLKKLYDARQPIMYPCRDDSLMRERRHYIVSNQMMEDVRRALLQAPNAANEPRSE